LDDLRPALAEPRRQPVLPDVLREVPEIEVVVAGVESPRGRAHGGILVRARVVCPEVRLPVDRPWPWHIGGPAPVSCDGTLPSATRGSVFQKTWRRSRRARHLVACGSLRSLAPPVCLRAPTEGEGDCRARRKRLRPPLGPR